MLCKVERISGELAFVYLSHPTRCLFETPSSHQDPASTPKHSCMFSSMSGLEGGSDRNRVDATLLTFFFFFPSLA